MTGSDQALWSPGAATGVGSLPGTDIREAVRIVFGELPDLPHLPELPDRGPGADLVGRSAGLLVGLPVALYAGVWHVSSRRGRDVRRTVDLLERDLDALAEPAEAYAGPLKVQAAGPWTLAAAIHRPIGGALLRDPGAVRELGASLAEGLAIHLAEVRRRAPRAQILVQLDEPMLPAVLAGRVPTESGLSMLAAVEMELATTTLAGVVTAAGGPVVVHCCAADAPVGLIRAAGAAAVGLDTSLLGDLDPLGEAVEAGCALFAGVVPTGAQPAGSAQQAAQAVLDIWHKLGLARTSLASQVVVTPACGLAGSTPAQARAAMTACREAGKRLRDAATD